VQVCPTGIDIRKGLQYECIACAACIDVCNDVMARMSYPKGLIRYATENGLVQPRGADTRQGGMWQRVARPRVLIYSSVLLLIVAAFVASLAMRPSYRFDVVRDRASLARLVEDGAVENVYRLQILNASEVPQRFRIELAGLPGLRLVGPVEAEVGPLANRSVAVAAHLDPAAAQGLAAGAHPVRFRLQALDGGGPQATQEEHSTFVMPR
jgi:polyferredoxin